MYLVGAQYNRIDIWDYHSKELVASLRTARQYEPFLFSCSYEFNLLAVCSGDCEVVVVYKISSTECCRELYQLSAPLTDTLINAVCFFKSSEKLLVGFDNNLAVFNAQSGTVECMTEVTGGVLTFAYGAVDKIISVSWSGIVQEWDADLREIRQQPVGETVYCACVARAEDTMAAACENVIIILDLATWTFRKIFEGIVQTCSLHFGGDGSRIANIGQLQFSDDGSRILVSVRQLWKLLLLDIVNETVLFQLDSGGGACYSFDFTRIYVSAADGCIISLDEETGSSTPTAFGPYLDPYEGLRGRRYDGLSVCSPAEVVLL
jgi:hypothetical protein